MKRKIQRALWGICVMCAVILAYGNTVNTAEPSPLELLSKLRALKTSSVSSTVHDGWLDEKIITLSAVSTPITVMRGTPETEEKIAQDIKGARYIYMTCQFLANPKIIQALCYAKRINSATIVCVLENKINAQNYITPDYLTQNGIFVFNPSESQKISGATMLLDNAKVYLFSDLDLSQASAPFCVCLTDSRHVTEASYYIYNILNTSEMSDYTKMRHPNAMRVINAELSQRLSKK